MNKSGHEYLTITETAKCKAIFFLGYNQVTSTFWFSIHGRILSLYKPVLITWQSTSVEKNEFIGFY